MLCACQYSIMNSISKRRFTVLGYEACAAGKQPLSHPLFCFFSLLSLFSFPFSSPAFWPSNLPSALQRSPYISLFCHLTLLLIAQSLSRPTVLMLENTVADKHRYTHSHSRYHRVYYKLSNRPWQDNFLIWEKPFIGVDNTNEWRLFLMALAVCGPSVWPSDAR